MWKHVWMCVAIVGLVGAAMIIGRSGPLDWAVSQGAEDMPLLQGPIGRVSCPKAGDVLTQGRRCIDGTGTRDVTALLQAELDGLPEPVGMGHRYVLPANATLRVSGRGLMLKRRTILMGNDSRLVVDNGSVGVTMGPGNPANWSTVKDLWILPARDGEVHEGIGIDVRTHGARIENVYIEFMGTGIRVATKVGDEYANVNSPKIHNVIVRYAHHQAIKLEGGDANAGLITGLEVIGGEGVVDHSFLGNTWVAPMIHTDEGAKHSIVLGHGAASHLVLGAYLEYISPAPTSGGPNNLWVGGHAVERLEGPGERLGRQAAKLSFRGNDGVRVMIPWDGADTSIAMAHPDEGEWWMLRFDSRRKLWGWRHRSEGSEVYRWSGAGHPLGTGVEIGLDGRGPRGQGLLIEEWSVPRFPAWFHDE